MKWFFISSNCHEGSVVCCSDSLFEYVLRYNFQICPSVQVLFSDIRSADHLDNINWEFFVRTVKYFFEFLASHNRFFLSSYQSVCTTFLQSVSMEGISLFVVNFFSKQLFADFFFLFPFLQCVHVLNLKIFRIMAWKTSIQNYFTLILFFFTISKRFNNPMHEAQCCMC